MSNNENIMTKSFGCAGCGCLCIVVVIIIGWASFFVLPLLHQHVNQAQYSGRVLPQVGEIRTRVGIYVYDKGTLPGIDASSTGGNGVCMSLIQTFVRNQDGSSEEYVPGCCTDDYQTVIPVGRGDQPQLQARHFAYDVGLQTSDLRDSTCKPSGYRYWVAVSSSNAYAYCVGYFPSDDCHLEHGTGYAVLEISSASLRQTAIWERYKPAGSMRIVLRPATNCIETAQTAGEGSCWLGRPELYLSDDPGKAEQGIRELKDAGWSFK